MENIYYHSKGRYQADYDRLVDLMPGSGQSETVAGELIRAVSKLGHELYNNGMEALLKEMTAKFLGHRFLKI